SDKTRKNLEACLNYLYQFGPEGVKDDRKALSILAKLLKRKEVLSADDLNKLSSAAGLFGYGSEAVKDIKKAIKAYEILKSYESHKELALLNLVYFYRYQAGHQDFPKAIACLRVLADHFKDQPAKRYEQLKALLEVCSIPAALGLGELQAATETLVRETEDEEGQLECYLHMANTCNIYPQHAQPSEILWVNQMIVMHPKADDEKVYESHSRMVAAYKAQGDLRQVAPAYHRLLNRSVALGNIVKKRLQADLYQFLNEGRDQAWVNEAELDQLRGIVFPPLGA
ncbi:MAG: hypothetical protein K2Q34_04680, partial [Alphaproteobacteria bacterium]|nr:hypothetical protein [Alphaproteobacteria bacterium]